MNERCYREIQMRNGVGGVSLFELLALLAVPIMFLPIFTYFEIHLILIIFIEAGLYAFFRFANKVSPFEFGVISYICFHFLWPKDLSAFPVQEERHIVEEEEPLQPSH